MGLVRTKYALSALRKYFREHNKESLICMGIIKLLLSFNLNAATHKLSLVDAHHLVHLVKMRTNLPIHEFLCNLGYATAAEDSDRMLAQLFRVPFTQLQSAPYATALMWASMQGQRYGSGWENQQILHKVLLPLLRDILPPLLAADTDTATETTLSPLATVEDCPQAVESLDAAWCDIVGPGSLAMYNISAAIHTADSSYKPVAATVPDARSSPLLLDATAPPFSSDCKNVKVLQRPFGIQAPSLPAIQVKPAKEAYAGRVNTAAAAAVAVTVASERNQVNTV